MADTTGPHGTLPAAIEFATPIADHLWGVGYFLHPSFADIDGDGDLETFVGDEYGKISVFLNTGSASRPAFAELVKNPYGLSEVEYLVRPSLVDIDGDGDPDLFAGNEFGEIAFFLNTGSASSPAFAAPVTNPYGLSNIGIRTDFVDIDGDGDLDAFVGDWGGNTTVFLNTGSASSPAFAAPMTNPYGLSDVGYGASPDFSDIDDDGDLDALVGNDDGNMLVFFNSGSVSSPAFAAPITNPYGLSDVGESASPDFADIDGDGDLDAYIGGYSKYFDSDHEPVITNAIWFFQNRGSSVSPVASSTSNGVYGVGSVITLTVAFNENVLVDTTGGIPT
ncbi:MAG: VCBS repeat-containing protein, partial [Pseudomonadota bacterium]